MVLLNELYCESKKSELRVWKKRKKERKERDIENQIPVYKLKSSYSNLIV